MKIFGRSGKMSFQFPKAPVIFWAVAHFITVISCVLDLANYFWKNWQGP